jgi:hypothetical protein
MAKTNLKLKSLGDLSKLQTTTAAHAVKRLAPQHDVTTHKGAVLWLKEMLRRGETERFMAEQVLTAYLARQLLELNEGNRRISKSTVATYVKALKDGAFNTMNGESIHISSCGLLNSGQHRLHAALESGVEIPWVFQFGVPREGRMTIDQPKVRSVADFLSMKDLADGHIIGAVAKMLHQWRVEGTICAFNKYKPGLSEIADFAAANYSKLAQSAMLIPRSGATLVGGTSTLAFIHVICAELDMELATDYVTRLVRGVDLEDGSPILAVRRRFASRDLNRRSDRIELLVRGWNALREKRKVASFSVGRYGIPPLV